MNSTIKKFVHDLIAEGLNLPKSQVIWYYPNAPRPAKPYATLEVYEDTLASALVDSPTISKVENPSLLIPAVFKAI